MRSARARRARCRAAVRVMMHERSTRVADGARDASAAFDAGLIAPPLPPVFLLLIFFSFTDGAAIFFASC